MVFETHAAVDTLTDVGDDEVLEMPLVDVARGGARRTTGELVARSCFGRSAAVALFRQCLDRGATGGTDASMCHYRLSQVEYDRAVEAGAFEPNAKLAHRRKPAVRRHAVAERAVPQQSVEVSISSRGLTATWPGWPPARRFIRRHGRGIVLGRSDWIGEARTCGREAEWLSHPTIPCRDLGSNESGGRHHGRHHLASTTVPIFWIATTAAWSS